ncbi:MAG: hypothetical protein KDM63_19670, partial [Verrucomicrobiae bacterium]|nr:hypothetical protein [Verrucomicrobiae bacterium]
FKPILVLNDSMKKVDPTFGDSGKQQFALEFTTGAEGWVKLQRQFGARTLSPDDQGTIWLLYDKVLFDEDPIVQVNPPAAPVSVRSVTPQQANAIKAK